jgi:hypothetical protein
MALPLFAVLDAQALIVHIEHQLNGSRYIDKPLPKGHVDLIKREVATET